MSAAAEGLEEQLVGLENISLPPQPIAIMDQVGLFSATEALSSLSSQLPVDTTPVQAVIAGVTESVDSVAAAVDPLGLPFETPWVGRDCEFTDTSDLRFDFGELVAGSDSEDFIQEGGFALACRNKGRYGVEVYDANNQPLTDSLVPVKVASAEGEAPASILLSLDDGPMVSRQFETEGGLLEHFHRLSAQLVSAQGVQQIPAVVGEIVGDPSYRLVIIKY